MAHAARQTWKEKRDRLMRSDFVGRQEELVAFRRSVMVPEATTMIFAISGQGREDDVAEGVSEDCDREDAGVVVGYL